MPGIVAYHLYFSTYGTWLHGSEKGSHDRFGRVLPDMVIKQQRENLLKHEPVTLSSDMRIAVDEAIRQVFEIREWKLHALNVRTNHVHVVVPHMDLKKAANDLKAYATRRLRQEELIEKSRQVWARSFGYRRIEDNNGLLSVVDYVKNHQ